MVDSVSGGDFIQSEPGSTGVCSSVSQDQWSEGHLAGVGVISTDGPTSGDPLHAYPVATPLNDWNEGGSWYNCHCAGEDVRRPGHWIPRTCCDSYRRSKVCHCVGMFEGLAQREKIS